MNLHVINTGYFKLDGGAMFGVVPKTIWNKSNPADENNLCNWAMRCLLIEDGARLILIDTGIGDKQDAKFFGHYYLNGDDTLDKSLAAKGFSRADITDVFLTHLHFDHCGGAITRNGDKLIPAFPNAVYWSNEKHWDWAVNPNDREKASFLKENILPIQESGQLKFAGTGDLPFNIKHAVVTQPGQKVKITRRFGKSDCFLVTLDESTGKYKRNLFFTNADVPTSMPRLGSVIGEGMYMIGKEDRVMAKSKIAVAKVTIK